MFGLGYYTHDVGLAQKTNAGPGSGLTSVGLTLPNTLMTVSNSPLTSDGIIVASLQSVSANRIFAGPTNGSSQQPTFRTIVSDDLALGAMGNLYLRGDMTWATVPPGTVTSVGLTTPGIFNVSGSPVTTSGNITISLANQNANRILAGPTTGASNVPSFRDLVSADIPNLDAAKITTGIFSTALLGTGTADNTTFLRGDNTWQSLPGGGSVTSVAMSVPSALLSVSGSPVTTSGTLAVTLQTQANNLVFAGPTSGGPLAPTFRVLDPTDIPPLDAAKITTGTIATARLGSGTANNTTFLRGDNTWQTLTGGGSVTSVDMTVPGFLSVSGNPITTSGTLAVTLQTQANNLVFAGPTTGGPLAPTFRVLDPTDIPPLDAAKITTGLLNVARGGTGVDASAASNGQLLIGNGSGFSLATLTAGSGISIGNSIGGITITATAGVTSVGLTGGSVFTITGSPITTAGTLDINLASVSANTVLAGAISGPGVTTPTFRVLDPADIPNLDAAKITTGTIATARLGTGTANNTTFLRGDNTWAVPAVTEVVDNVFRIVDNGDATKKLAFEVSAIATATTRTITIPDRNVSLDTLSGSTQTTGLGSGRVLYISSSSTVATSSFFTFDNSLRLLTIAGNNQRALYVENSSSTPGHTAIEAVSLGTASTYSLIAQHNGNTGTSSVQATARFAHNSSNTPTVGYGVALDFTLKSSTTINQDAARITTLWTTATHASRSADLVFSLVANAAALAERFRISSVGVTTSTVTSNTNAPFTTELTTVLATGITPAANFGSRKLTQLWSDTSTLRDASALETTWIDATDATRSSVFDIRTFQSGSLDLRLRASADGVLLTNQAAPGVATHAATINSGTNVGLAFIGSGNVVAPGAVAVTISNAPAGVDAVPKEYLTTIVNGTIRYIALLGAP